MADAPNAGATNAFAGSTSGAGGPPRVPAVTVVVPTYNEALNVETLARRLFAAVDPAAAELLIVDDNSPDGTAAVAERLAAELPVRCLVRRDERGLATAVLAGLRDSRGDIVVVMDADLSHPPEAVPSLVAALADPQVEMALGSRFVAGGHIDQGWPWHRRMLSWGGRLLARPLCSVRDLASGFFAMRRQQIHFERLAPVGYKIALELIVRHGWRHVVEVPITFADRAAGQTKLTFGEQFRYLRHLARLYAWVVSGRH